MALLLVMTALFSKSAALSGFATPISTAVPPPPMWIERAAQGQLLWSASEPSMLGLFPSLGNGFLSGDVGCPSARLVANTSSVHEPPTSCGALHIGGVFNDLEFSSHYGSVAHNLSIPHRADIPNPFAIYVDSLQTGAVALDTQYGRVSNLSMATCEAQPGENLSRDAGYDARERKTGCRDGERVVDAVSHGAVPRVGGGRRDGDGGGGRGHVRG